MIHGAQDDVVVWQHSVLYQRKAVELGVQLDYAIYPGHYHNVLGKDRAHLMEKICNYFTDNL
jgi:dipeptidyl-peptidase-4